jgi:hypothetical protein
MQGIKRLIENNPEILKVHSLDPEKNERRFRYEAGLRYDKVEELARGFISWALKIPSWRIDSSTRGKMFDVGKNASKEYDVNLQEIERLFSDVLSKYMRGGLLGFYISGLCKYLMKDKDTLKLDLRKYPASISGLGYRHSCGRLEVTGNKAYYLGMKMEGGEIVVKGNVGNYLGKSMKGGCIIVEGDAKNWVGEKMQGGLILIKGNAGNIIGEKMTGGEINIKGDAGYWIGEDATGGMIRLKDYNFNKSTDFFG